MGDGDLSSGDPADCDAVGDGSRADGRHRMTPSDRSAREWRRGTAFGTWAKVAAWLVMTTLVGSVAASCGGDADRGVTPLAERSRTSAVEPDSSPIAANGDTEATASTKKAQAANSTAADDPAVATPTSAPSAERFADGSVVSAGGYEAKTPAVARGLLLEPEWTKEQQEAADVIHQYLDAMITTVTDKKPDKKIPTSMSDLERPDLNSAGLVQLDTQNLVRGATKLNQYMAEPESSETAYWVFDLSTLEGGRLQVAMCDYNDLLGTDLDTDAVVDDAITSAFWDGQLAPTDGGWRVVTLVHQGAKKGRAGCAAE